MSFCWCFGFFILELCIRNGEKTKLLFTLFFYANLEKHNKIKTKCSFLFIKKLEIAGLVVPFLLWKRFQWFHFLPCFVMGSI
jgi:hypothetical protein